MLRGSLAIAGAGGVLRWCHATAIDDRPTESCPTGPDGRDSSSPGAPDPPHATRSSTPPPNCSPTSGYTGTSTRKIAEAVGIRRHRYHSLRHQDDILAAAAHTTVTGSLDHARRLLGRRQARTGPAVSTSPASTSGNWPTAGGTSARSICARSPPNGSATSADPDRTRRRVRNARRRGDR